MVKMRNETNWSRVVGCLARFWRSEPLGAPRGCGLVWMHYPLTPEDSQYMTDTELLGIRAMGATLLALLRARYPALEPRPVLPTTNHPDLRQKLEDELASQTFGAEWARDPSLASHSMDEYAARCDARAEALRRTLDWLDTYVPPAPEPGVVERIATLEAQVAALSEAVACLQAKLSPDA
jgi:hypothetical protein